MVNLCHLLQRSQTNHKNSAFNCMHTWHEVSFFISKNYIHYFAACLRITLASRFPIAWFVPIANYSAVLTIRTATNSSLGSTLLSYAGIAGAQSRTTLDRRSFISTDRPTIHTNPPWKNSSNRRIWKRRATSFPEPFPRPFPAPPPSQGKGPGNEVERRGFFLF